MGNIRRRSRTHRSGFVSEATRNILVESGPRLKQLEADAAEAAADSDTQKLAKLNDVINEQRNIVATEVSAYSGFGFERLSWGQVTNWASGKGNWGIKWGERIRHMLKILLGWTVMTLLLRGYPKT